VPAPLGEGTVQVRLYDPIDSWGGEWGISAKEFAAAIDALPEGTEEIRLMINSPGGEVWDGMAILNTLRAHPARVVAVVEGIAASSASFIAAGADEVVMMKNSEMYVHNAWGMAMGDADDLRSVAAEFERLDRNIASIYAEKSGKSVDEWLTEMPKDRFYTAEEAVEAGLADRIEGVGDAAAARARFDLTVFARAGKQPAAAITSHNPPSSTEPGVLNGKDAVAMTDLADGLRERLGATDAETDEELLAALDAALANDENEDENDETDTPAARLPEGVVAIEAEALADLRRDAQLGAQARAEQINARRDGIVANAIREGRISPKSQAKWRALLEKDEAGTVDLINDLAANAAIPVAERGISDDVDTADDRHYAAVYGTPKES
jgi:ATP-dependent Clp endopeptidase proteolytic subunit ClpP